MRKGNDLAGGSCWIHGGGDLPALDARLHPGHHFPVHRAMKRHPFLPPAHNPSPGKPPLSTGRCFICGMARSRLSKAARCSTGSTARTCAARGVWHPTARAGFFASGNSFCARGDFVRKTGTLVALSFRPSPLPHFPNNSFTRAPIFRRTSRAVLGSVAE